MKSADEATPSRWIAHPRALEPLERPRPHLLAQRVEHERAAEVDVDVEDVVRVARARLAGRAVLRPQLVLDPVDEPHERLEVRCLVHAGVVGDPAVLVRPQQLVPRGMALVEPDVAPLVRRDAVPEPHVRQLVQHRRAPDALVVVAEPGDVVERQRLRLEREAELRVHDERPVGVERVRARRGPASSRAAGSSWASFGRRSAVRLGGVTSRTTIPSWTPRGVRSKPPTASWISSVAIGWRWR